MLDLWLSAGLLMLTALAFLMYPLLRRQPEVIAEDRTALNVALYQERLAELSAQQAAGTLSGEQFETGKAEAARELLADTEGKTPLQTTRLGKAIPILAAVLMPFLGLGLYWHWGGSEQVELTREYENAPRTLEEMTARLQATVKAQPEAAEAWYFLGRTYMAQSLYLQASEAFQQAAELANRPPEVLGQLAQARFFAGERQWTPALQALTDEALKADPQESTSLGLLGIAAFESARYADAMTYWQRLLDAMPPDDAAREQILSGIERARSNLLASGGSLPELAVAAAAQPVRVRVDLASAIREKVQPGDTLFVFAKAASGPPMPLAMKRLTVADLPVEVSLSDADAMMPQLKISAFPQIQLMARISRAGNATAGEWVGASQAIASNGGELHQITIDRPDTP